MYPLNKPHWVLGYYDVSMILQYPDCVENSTWKSYVKAVNLQRYPTNSRTAVTFSEVKVWLSISFDKGHRLYFVFILEYYKLHARLDLI